MNKRILVIDDDTAVRKTICENLAECGYDITEASDGEQGLQSLEKDGFPALVITDIIMPNKEGLETIIAIRDRYPHLKLIAISGGSRTKSTDFLELAKKLGAHAIFTKPIDLDELEKTVQSLLAA